MDREKKLFEFLEFELLEAEENFEFQFSSLEKYDLQLMSYMI